MSRVLAVAVIRSIASLVSIVSAASFALGCAVQAEDDAAARDGRAVLGEGPACEKAAAPIPEGWTVRAMSSFSVAAPNEGLLTAESAPNMVQFYSAAPGTSLAAFERRDVLSLDEAAATWKRALGEKCALTSERTTHLCDEALRLRATCPGDRTTEVLVVHRHGATFSASCEISGGDAATCAPFLASLRIR
jgi:hypothetical protein